MYLYLYKIKLRFHIYRGRTLNIKAAAIIIINNHSGLSGCIAEG